MTSAHRGDIPFPQRQPTEGYPPFMISNPARSKGHGPWSSWIHSFCAHLLHPSPFTPLYPPCVTWLLAGDVTCSRFFFLAANLNKLEMKFYIANLAVLLLLLHVNAIAQRPSQDISPWFTFNLFATGTWRGWVYSLPLRWLLFGFQYQFCGVGDYDKEQNTENKKEHVYN